MTLQASKLSTDEQGLWSGGQGANESRTVAGGTVEVQRPAVSACAGQQEDGGMARAAESVRARHACHVTQPRRFGGETDGFSAGWSRGMVLYYKEWWPVCSHAGQTLEIRDASAAAAR